MADILESIKLFCLYEKSMRFTEGWICQEQLVSATQSSTPLQVLSTHYPSEDGEKFSLPRVLVTSDIRRLTVSKISALPVTIRHCQQLLQTNTNAMSNNRLKFVEFARISQKRLWRRNVYPFFSMLVIQALHSAVINAAGNISLLSNQ